MKSRKSGSFTLIEVLVVIAIIGVLAALLLPALTRSREYAKRTYCQNNLSQFGVMLRTYLNRYGDWMPAPRTWSCGGSTRDPHGLPYHPIDLLSGGFSERRTSFYGYMGGLISARECPKVVYCPSTDIEDGTSFDDQDPLKQYWWNSHCDSWGGAVEVWQCRVNLWDWPHSSWPEVNFPLPNGWVRVVYTTASSVSRQSDLAVMGDSPDHNGRYIPAGSPWMDFAGPTRWGESSVSRRHLGGSNLLFFDGHVEWKHWDFLEIQENNKYWLLPWQKSDPIFFPHD